MGVPGGHFLFWFVFLGGGFPSPLGKMFFKMMFENLHLVYKHVSLPQVILKSEEFIVCILQYRRRDGVAEVTAAYWQLLDAVGKTGQWILILAISLCAPRMDLH